MDAEIQADIDRRRAAEEALWAAMTAEAEGAGQVTSAKGWTHEEAKRHTLAERLHERCRVYGGQTCGERHLPEPEWCERCLAVRVLRDAVEEMESMVAYVPDYFREKWGYDESIAAIKDFIVGGRTTEVTE